MNKHEERVLQKLYRKYEDNDLWKFLIKVCKDRGVENGILKSEIEELKEELNLLKIPVVYEKVIAKNKRPTIAEIIKDLDFDDYTIENCNDISTLQNFKAKVIKSKNEYAKKNWYLNYLEQSIIKKLSVIDDSKNQAKKFRALAYDMLDSELFNRINELAKQ